MKIKDIYSNFFDETRARFGFAMEKETACKRLMPPKWHFLLACFAWSLFLCLPAVVQADVTNVWDFSNKTNYYMPDEDVYIEIDEANKRAQLVLLAEEKHFSGITDYTDPSAQSSYLKYGAPVSINLSKAGASYSSYGKFTSRIFSDVTAGNRWQYMSVRASNLDYVTDPSLVALYRMDDDGWLDVVSGAHGVMYGGASFSTDSMIGSHSGDFRGIPSGDYVRTDNKYLLNGKDAFSLAFWVKVRIYREHSGLVLSRYSNSQLLGVSLSPAATPGLRFSIFGNPESVRVSMPIDMSQWTFVVATCDTQSDGYLRLYTNGVLSITSVASVGSVIRHWDEFAIGADDYSVAQRSLNGLIDEIAIWDRAISSNEVSSLYISYLTLYPFRMQVRSGDSISSIETNAFVGPDGTTNSFYPSGNQALIGCDDFNVSNAFSQYSVQLYSSLDHTKTPYLQSIGFFGTEGFYYDDLLYDFERGDFTLNTESSGLPSPWPYLGLAKDVNGGYNVSGIYESRVMQAVSGVDSTWNEISWTFAGEGLADDLLGMIGMYHCENSWGDSSVAGGVQSGNPSGMVYTNTAKIGTQSAVFDGSATVVDNFGIGTLQSIEFWINNDNVNDAIMSFTASTFINISNHIIEVSGFANAYPKIYINASSASPRLKGGWNHVAIVWNSSVDASGLMIGRVSSDYMEGQMDEVAVYSRTLSAAEVSDHFVRGRSEVAGDIRFQARASNDPTFAGVDYVGFGGTSNDYHNIPGTLATGVGEYFQYRILLDGSGDATPGVCSVDIVYNAFADQFSDNMASNFYGGSLYYDDSLQWYGDEAGLRDWSALTPPTIRPIDYGGLIGLWHFENDWTDEVGGGTAISSVGAKLSKFSAIGGYCASLDGYGGTVTLGSGALGSSPFSLSLWMRTVSTNQCAIISSYTGQNHFTLELQPDGSVAFIIDDYIAAAPNPRIALSYRKNLNDGRWHHVVGVRNSNQILVYADGDLLGAQNIGSYGGIGGAAPVLGNSSASGYFKGSVDEVAIFSYALSEAEIGELSGAGVTTRQQASFTGAIIDATQPAIWEKLSWSIHGIFDNTISPSDFDVAGLWHLDELGGGVAVDSSINGNDGVVPVSAQGGAGKFSSCLNFTTSQNMTIGNDAALEPGNLTIEAWVYFDDVIDAPVVDKRNAGLTAGYALGTDANGKPYFWIGTSSAGIACSGYSALRSKQWTHLAGVYNGTDILIYVNGEQVGRVTPGAVAIAAGDLLVGIDLGGVHQLKGRVDELSLFRRGLKSYEILDHYKAGAVSLKFQGRAWDPPPQGPLVGPGTNTATYFTDWLNSDLRTGMELGQYMEYKSYLSSDTHRYGPVLRGISVDHSSFSYANPTVEPVEISAASFVGRLISFEHDVLQGVRTDVKYQISGDNGVNPKWYYYAGSNGWTDATMLSPQYTYASSRTDINANIGSFYDQLYDKVGGVLRFRAFLHSEGDYQVLLNEIRVVASEGSITLTSPNGAEIGTKAWITDVPYDITWISAGNVGTVSIDLYGSGGLGFIKNLGSSLPNNGVFNTVVHNNEGLYSIKISDEVDGSIYDSSDSDFALTNDFHLTSPDGGEFWYAGQNNPITWDSPSPVPAINVDLWFSYDGDATNLASWFKVASSLPNAVGNNSHIWATPSNDWHFVSEDAKMAVTPAGLPHPLLPGAAKRDFSDAVFTMGGIAITYPSIGVGVKTGNAIDILYTAAGVGTNGVTVRLFDGVSWSVLSSNAPCVPGANVFNTVVAGQTEAARIDIRSNSAPPNDVYGISEPFTLADINVLSPVGGSAGVRDYWPVGTTNTIMWTAGGAGGSVNIEYSSALSSNWYPIAMNTVNVNSGANVVTNMVQWIVQGPPSDTVKVRVKTTDLLQPDLYDITEAFTVPGIELTAPTGGEVWEFVGTNRVNWLNMGGLGGVDVDVSFDSGVRYETVRAGVFSQNGQNYFDILPGDLRRPSVHAVFKLVQPNTVSGIPAIDSMERMGTELTIRGVSVPVPTNSAVYTLGTTVPKGLHWFSAFTGDPNADLAYSSDGINFADVIMWGASSEFSNLDEDTCSNAYDWIISPRLKPSSIARVQVRAGAYTAVSDPFVMRGVRITQPAKGAMFDIGSSQFVRWDFASLAAAALASNSVSTAGVGGTFIKAGLTNDATILFQALQWDIDSDIDPTTNAVIKMQVYAPAEDTDITVYSEPFTLRGLKVSTPSTGSSWWLGGAETVSFRAAGMGAGARVDVYYSADGMNYDMTKPVANNMLIADGLNSFTWNIESSYALSRLPSTNAHIMIVSGVHTNISRAFTLNGIKVTKPKAGDVLAVSDGTSQVEWTAVGAAANFNLSFTVWEGTNGPYPHVEAIATVGLGVSSYTWPMPASSIGTKVTISAVSGAVTGYSEEFEVVARPTVRLLDLNNEIEYLKVGTSKKIEWVRAGAMTNSFALYYSKMPSGTPVQLGVSGSFPLVNGVFSYDWDPIPNNLGQIKLMITNLVNSSIFDVSTNFAIAPTFNIRTFTADLYAKKEHRVYFTPDGSIQHGVDLYYNTDPFRGVANWNLINTEGPVPAQHAIETYFPWTVADLRTNTVWLRIQDHTFTSEVFAASKAGPYDDYGMFEIKYYRILWQVFDAETSNQLSNVSVADSSGWSAAGLSSPIVHWYPYGTWNTEWYREYFSDEVMFNWNSRSDATNNIWMERSEIEPDYHVMANFSYNVASSNFMIQSWLERGGSILESAESCTITIYNSSGTLEDSLMSATSLNGVFWQNWNVSGRGYSSTDVFFGRIEVGFSGSTYSSGVTFMMRQAASSEVETVLDYIEASTTNILNHVTGVATNVSALRGEVQAGFSSITTVVTNMAAGIDAMTNAVLVGMHQLTNQMDQVIQIVTPMTNLTAQISDISTDVLADLARILTRPTTLLYGSTNSILYKTRTGYASVQVSITVSNASQGLVYSDNMTEIVGGIYQHDIVADWGTNSYTITCADIVARDSMVVDVVGETQDLVPPMIIAMSNQIAAISAQIANISNMVSGIAGADLTPLISGIEEIKASVANVGDVDLTGLSSEIAGIQTSLSALDLSSLERIESVIGDSADSSTVNTFFGHMSMVLENITAVGDSASNAEKNAQSAKTEAGSAVTGIQEVKDLLQKGDINQVVDGLDFVVKSMRSAQSQLDLISKMMPLADLHSDIKSMATSIDELAQSKTFKDWVTPQEDLKKGGAGGAEGVGVDALLILNRNMEEVKSSMSFMGELLDEMRFEPVIEETLLAVE